MIVSLNLNNIFDKCPFKTHEWFQNLGPEGKRKILAEARKARETNSLQRKRVSTDLTDQLANRKRKSS